MVVLFNVIILDQQEKVLKYLNSDYLDIEEAMEKKGLRTITLTYPLQDNVNEVRDWFKIGNKIYVPAVNGLEECLYVINNNCKIDYWNDNNISLSAEEVLSELNYVDLFTQTDTKTVTVNRSRLEEWFGEYFNIGIVENCLNQNLQVISTAGTMTKLGLLRHIEEKTSNIFRTRYEKEENTNLIKRYLDFLQPGHIGKHHDVSIDLNYTADNIEFEVDEADTYRAIAPILSLNENENESNTAGADNTTNSAITREDLTKIINDWKQLAVDKGEVIPMIVEKQTETDTSTNETIEKIVYTAYWQAPFRKEAGKLYIIDDIDTNCEYNSVLNRPDAENSNSIPKIGTVGTSDTDKYAIYNDCAMKLIEKRYPELSVSVSMKDLEETVQDENSFNIYDTCYLRIPGFDKLQLIDVEKTSKNPHLPGENNISFSNADLSTRIVQKGTVVEAANTNINYGKGEYFKAKLLSDGEPVVGKTCSITVVKPDSKVTTTVTTKAATTSNNAETITVSMRPSCAYHCGEYKVHTTTFVKKCAFCGSTNLKINPKRTYEGEITCGKCDADYCGVCGREKMYPSRARLTKASAQTTSTESTTTTETKDIKGYTKVYTMKTDKDGVFKLQINLLRGDYTLKCNFGGDIEYGASSKNVSLKVT